MGTEIWNSVCLHLLGMLGIGIDTAELYGMEQSPSKKAQHIVLRSVAGMARKVPGVLRWAGEVGVLWAAPPSNGSVSDKGNLTKCVKWVYSETPLLDIWDYHMLFISHKSRCLLEASHFSSLCSEYIAKKYLQIHFTQC